MSMVSGKSRCTGSYFCPPKSVPPGMEDLYLFFRGVISWFILRLPLGKLRKAEEERIERATNWGRW